MAKNTDPLGDLLKNAEKKYGLRVGPMIDVAEDIKTVSTGNMALDYAMGGGVPLGRSVELFGLPSCGKTTMALQVAANYQKIILAGGDDELGIAADDHILYLDYEQAMDKEYAKALGLDTEHSSFLFTQPDSLEDGANFSLEAVKSGKVRLIIFDSVALMTPSAKAEAEIGKSLPAVQAKLMKDFLMNFTPLLYKNNTTAIFLNHQMEKMEMGGRPGMPIPITTPGGVALKYVMSVRVQFTKIRDHKEEVVDPVTAELVSRPMTSDVKVKVVKNKVAPPFREAIVRVRFGEGFDELATALQALLASKKIMYQAGYYYFHKIEEQGFAPEWMARMKTGTNRPYIKGEKNVYRMAAEHPEWRSGLIEMARQVVQDNISAVTQQGAAEEDDSDDEE